MREKKIRLALKKERFDIDVWNGSEWSTDSAYRISEADEVSIKALLRMITLLEHGYTLDDFIVG